MIDIFVSYTRKDLRRVWPLTQALKEYGWHVWWDQDMQTGAKIDVVMDEHLNSARAVVGVVSRHFSESDWAFGEMEKARRGNKLFPVLLDGMEPPIWLGRIQAAEFAGWSEESSSPHFRKLAADLVAVLGPPAKPAEKVQGAGPLPFKSPRREFRGKGKRAGMPDDGSSAGGTETKTEPTTDDTFEDPTIAFPRTAAIRQYRFPSDSLHDLSKRLQSERLIGVRSPDDGITSSAVDALLESDDFKDYDLRLLAFDAANQLRTDLSLEDLIQHGVGRPNRATIVVVDPHGALPFIESIFCGPHQAKAIAFELRRRDLLFIVQIGSRYQRDLAPRFDTFRFACWDVDWLEPLLTRLFPTETPALLNRLLEQRRKGYWGTPHNDLEFHEILQAALAGGREGLQQALDQRESTSLEPVLQQPSLDAFRSGAPYCRGILLCAAFFPGLDVFEFRKLCLAVVGEAKVFVPDSMKDTNGRVRTTSRMSTLESEWPDVADEIFRECGLTVVKSQGKRAVTFTRPEERASLAAFINSQAHFFANTARKLWAAGFFFARDSSSELVDGMTALFVAAVDHDNSQKQPQWLSNLLILQLSGQADSLSDFLQKAVLNYFVLSRVSRLLRSLLGIQEYASLVKIWFDDLLSRNGHLHALRLATHLKFTEGFDYLYWLKRFCNEGSDNVRRESYLALYQHAQQSSAQIWDFLSELESWLPRHGRTSALELSKSNEDALRLIIEYSFDTGNEVKLQDVGKWPSRYPLFRDIALDWESASTRLKSLISWLFHPALTALFDEDSPDAVWDVRGQLILLWSHVLLGVDGDLIDPQARVTYHQILSLCWQHADQLGRGELCEVWRSQKESFLNQRTTLDSDGFAYLTKWISLIENLENDFRAVAAKDHESSAQATTAPWSTAQI